MRKGPWCILTGLISVGGVIFAGLYDYDTHVVRGWVRGEAFYLARPTSHWRRIVQEDMKRSQREMQADYHADEIGDGGIVNWAFSELGIEIKRTTSEALARDSLARPVLEELSRDGSPRIRGFATYLLDPKNQRVSRFPRDPDPKILEDWYPPAISLVIYLPWHRAHAMSCDLPDD